MSGQPGDIPKFVSDMIGPMAAEELQPVHPASEVAQPSGQTQPVCDDRPKSDIPETLDATRPSYEADRKSYELQRQEPSTPVNDGPSASGGRVTDPRLSQTLPKSDIPQASDAICYQAHKKSVELERREPSKRVNDGPSTSGELGSIPCLSAGKPGTGLKDEKPGSIAINKETQRLVDELQRQYAQPIFINDGVQFLVDDAKERSVLTTSGSSRQQKSEKCKRVCALSL